MKYKMVCSDLDGTLLVSGGEPCDGLKEGIKEYEKRGGKFVVVTGRMTAGALPICKMLDLKGELITYQGAIISDIESGKIVFEKTIPYEKAAEIGRFIEENGWYYQTYIDNTFYTEKPDDFTKFYGKISYANYEKTDGKLSDFLLKTKVNVPKLLIKDDPKNIPEILRKVREKFGNDYMTNVSNPSLVEIIDKSVGKGLAVKSLAEKYGIKREEVLCIGDSENDLTMIEYAGLGVCVKNGSEILKKNADFITPKTCEENAVLWAIENLAEK